MDRLIVELHRRQRSRSVQVYGKTLIFRHSSASAARLALSSAAHLIALMPLLAHALPFFACTKIAPRLVKVEFLILLLFVIEKEIRSGFIQGELNYVSIKSLPRGHAKIDIGLITVRVKLTCFLCLYSAPARQDRKTLMQCCQSRI